MSELTDKLRRYGIDPQEVIEDVCRGCRHDHGWSLSEEPYAPEPGTTPCDIQARFGAGYEDVAEMVLDPDDPDATPICTAREES